MAGIKVDKQVYVIEIVRVFADARLESHKQGWLYPGALVHCVEEYTRDGIVWYRIDGWTGRADMSGAAPEYPEYWIQKSFTGAQAPSTPPAPTPIPGTISDEAAFAAFKTLVLWLKQL